MLKHLGIKHALNLNFQPPSGGCVLKPFLVGFLATLSFQPPSGGCVLKLDWLLIPYPNRGSAAFGRLCVETQL